MIKEPKIRGKDSRGYKAGWLNHEYTLEARAFYSKEHAQAQAVLNRACAASPNAEIARHYERLVAIEEILALLTHNEQNRDDDE